MQNNCQQTSGESLSSPLREGKEGQHDLKGFIARNRDWIAVALLAGGLAMGTSAFWKRLWRDELPSPATIEQVTEDSIPTLQKPQPAGLVRKVFLEKAKSSPVRPQIEAQR